MERLFSIRAWHFIAIIPYFRHLDCHFNAENAIGGPEIAIEVSENTIDVTEKAIDVSENPIEVPEKAIEVPEIEFEVVEKAIGALEMAVCPATILSRHKSRVAHVSE